MKNIILQLITSLLFINCVQAHNYDYYQELETIETGYEFNKQSNDNALYIHNINGSIQIEGYEGDEIKVDIQRTTSASSKSHLQLGLNEAHFKVVHYKNQVHMYIKTPFTSLELVDGILKLKENNRHNNNKYEYNLDYKVRVPKNTNLNLTTYNKGTILINNIQAKLIKAYNINGEIHLDKVKGTMDIKTINGDISLAYFDKFIKDSRFESINGSFDVKFIDKPNIEILYETMNGAFYSNFDITSATTEFKKSAIKNKSGIKFKLKPRKKITIGSNSDTKFIFKTLNGDITIAQKT